MNISRSWVKSLDFPKPQRSCGWSKFLLASLSYPHVCFGVSIVSPYRHGKSPFVVAYIPLGESASQPNGWFEICCIVCLMNCHELSWIVTIVTGNEQGKKLSPTWSYRQIDTTNIRRVSIYIPYMLGISSLDEYVHLDSNSATFLVASPKLPGTAVEIFFQVYGAEASGELRSSWRSSPIGISSTQNGGFCKWGYPKIDG